MNQKTTKGSGLAIGMSKSTGIAPLCLEAKSGVSSDLCIYGP